MYGTHATKTKTREDIEQEVRDLPLPWLKTFCDIIKAEQAFNPILEPLANIAEGEYEIKKQANTWAALANDALWIAGVSLSIAIMRYFSSAHRGKKAIGFCIGQGLAHQALSRHYDSNILFRSTCTYLLSCISVVDVAGIAQVQLTFATN